METLSTEQQVLQPIQNEATKVCSNCKKPIEMSKFRIHEIGCIRNNYKCGQCNEIVPKIEKDQHEKEFHSIVMCEFCNDFECEKMILNEHQQYCEMKPKECKYCELIMPQGPKYDDHIVFCGSKTQKCPDCGSQIRNSEMRAHKISDTCSVIKEMQKDRVKNELERFQKEEEKQVGRNINQIFQKQGGSNFNQTATNQGNQSKQKDDKFPQKNDNIRGYSKSKETTKEKQALVGQLKRQANQRDHRNLENERAITKAMQEEQDHEEAKRLQAQLAREGVSGQENEVRVRAPIAQFEDTLIAPDEYYEQPNKRRNFGTVFNPPKNATNSKSNQQQTRNVKQNLASSSSRSNPANIRSTREVQSKTAPKYVLKDDYDDEEESDFIADDQDSDEKSESDSFSDEEESSQQNSRDVVRHKSKRLTKNSTSQQAVKSSNSRSNHGKNSQSSSRNHKKLTRNSDIPKNDNKRVTRGKKNPVIVEDDSYGEEEVVEVKRTNKNSKRNQVYDEEEDDLEEQLMRQALEQSKKEK
eukprot:403375053